MSMNRRGLLESTVVGLAILAASFILVFGVAIRTGFLSNQDADTNLCRVSLAAQDMTQIGLKDSVYSKDSSLNSACKRRIITIDDSGIYPIEKNERKAKMRVYLPTENGLRAVTSYSLNGAAAKQVINSHFSESLRRCWVRGLEGEVTVFNARGFDFTRNTVCMLCDETHMSISAPLTGGTGFNLYQKTTVMPASDEQTYAEYLYDIKTLESGNSITNQPQCLVDANIQDEPFTRDGSYVTLFFRHFSGYNQGCMAVAVVPAQQVRSLCDYVAN